MSRAWRLRGSDDRPRITVHGVEHVSQTSWDDLVRSAASVTLLSVAGHEIVVGDVKAEESGAWKGKVLKAVAGSVDVRVGSVVGFSTAQVQTVTRR